MRNKECRKKSEEGGGRRDILVKSVSSAATVEMALKKIFVVNLSFNQSFQTI
jgi:hypothetical protein